jgi:hypothetical protein
MSVRAAAEASLRLRAMNGSGDAERREAPIEPRPPPVLLDFFGARE